VTATGDTIYEYTDLNVTNNYTYRYWVSAYSHGDSLEEPLETPPENNPALPNDNTVEVTPASVLAQNSLKDVRVVPNPYIVSAPWESEPGLRKIAFTGLPETCQIRIFNAAGELVRSLDHTNGQSFEYWNVRNQQDQEVAPGLYFYHIHSSRAGDTAGKLVIIL
jgi:hypothetical protein